MKKALVSFEIIKPPGIEDDEFMEWLNFELGLVGSMSIENNLEYGELRDMVQHLRIIKKE